MTAKTTAQPKSARTQIKEHTKAVRAENAKAHADRVANCTAAAETAPAEQAPEVKVTRVPTGASGVDAKGKARKLHLTSPKKRGAARTAKAQATALRTRMTKRVGRFDWSKLPEGIDHAKAETMASMLLDGEATGRMVEDAIGLSQSDRAKVPRGPCPHSYDHLPDQPRSAHAALHHVQEQEQTRSSVRTLGGGDLEQPC